MLTRNAPAFLNPSCPVHVPRLPPSPSLRSGPPTPLTHAPKLDSFQRPIVGANFLPPRPLFPLQSVQCLHPFHQWWILQHRNCFAGMYTSSMMSDDEVASVPKHHTMQRGRKSSCIVHLDTGWKSVVVGLTLQVPYSAGKIRLAYWILASAVGISWRRG